MASSKEDFGKLISTVKPIAEIAIAKYGDKRFIYFENHRKLTIEFKYIESLREGRIHSINLKLYKGTFLLVKEQFGSIREMILVKQEDKYMVAKNDGFQVSNVVPDGFQFVKDLFSEFIQRCTGPLASMTGN